MATNSIKLLTGNSYPELARLVADRYVEFHKFLLTHALLSANLQRLKRTRTVPIIFQFIISERT
jgi:hypothetical protein